MPWIAREMPKSITCGPSSASSTFAGLRSRCTRPRGVHRAQRLGEPGGEPPDGRLGQRPYLATTSSSGGPGTYAVASHGGLSFRPEPTTGAVYMPLTARAAATSRRNRCRNSWSRASCGCTTLIATARPAGEKPR